jgi:predicted transcriptional regulator
MPLRRRSAPQFQDTVRLSAEGLAKVLGDLEARVLRTVWSFPEPQPARVIHERLLQEHTVSHLTTITVLNKLVAKGILARASWDGLFHYSALLSQDQFMRRVSRHVVEGILSLQPDAVTASFVDVLAEHRPEQLEELARLVRRRMREQGGKEK